MPEVTAGYDCALQTQHKLLRSFKTLAQRIANLDSEVGDLDTQLKELVAATAPTLISRTGISTGHAAQFLITAGENIDRLHSDAAFAESPRSLSHQGARIACDCTEVVTAKQNGHLHLVTVVRLRFDPRTIAYMQRRRAEVLPKRDVMRCLKRFIAREVFNDLRTDLSFSTVPNRNEGDTE